MRKFESSVFFFLSPLLSLPIILRGVSKRSEYHAMLMALLFGFLSYLYIPDVTNDKKVYLDYYNDFQIQGFAYFEYVLSNRPDFILHSILYSFATLHIPFPCLYFVVTSWTVGVCFYIFMRVAKHLEITNKNIFIGFLMVLFSFSLPDLFSGTKFYFASSFVFLSFYVGLFCNKKRKGLLLIFIAPLVHFSTLIFLLIYILCILTPSFLNIKSKLPRLFFLISFIFLFIPSFISSANGIIQSILPPLYMSKFEAYTTGEDFVQSGLKLGSSNYIYAYIMTILWSYIAYIYLLVYSKEKSILRNLVYFSFAIINIFYVFTTVYSRYLLVLKFMFVILFFIEQHKHKKRMLLFIFILLISIISNVIIMRNNITESYANYYSIFPITVLFSDY